MGFPIYIRMLGFPSYTMFSCSLILLNIYLSIILIEFIEPDIIVAFNIYINSILLIAYYENYYGTKI
jgi:uncharacterized membrane protein (DUF485 family)